MMRFIKYIFFLLPLLSLSNCADDKPFLSGFIRQASTALMVPCDPNDLGKNHTCVVYSSSSFRHLVVYNATAEEMVLGPNRYTPLAINVGQDATELADVKSPKEHPVPYFLALDTSGHQLFAVRTRPS